MISSLPGRERSLAAISTFCNLRWEPLGEAHYEQTDFRTPFSASWDICSLVRRRAEELYLEIWIHHWGELDNIRNIVKDTLYIAGSMIQRSQNHLNNQLHFLPIPCIYISLCHLLVLIDICPFQLPDVFSSWPNFLLHWLFFYKVNHRIINR